MQEECQKFYYIWILLGFAISIAVSLFRGWVIAYSFSGCNVYLPCLTGNYHSSLLEPCILHLILHLIHLFSKGEVGHPEKNRKVVTKPEELKLNIEISTSSYLFLGHFAELCRSRKESF